VWLIGFLVLRKMNLQNFFLLSAISLHFLLGFLQIYSFPNSKYLQKVYLAQHFESSAALEVVQLQAGPTINLKKNPSTVSG
jgi:hypothetical protein